MVNHEAQLNRVFAALVHPTRRSILALLDQEREGLSVSGIADPLHMKLPALLKHLSVLEEAELVRREKIGRTVQIHLAPEPMAQATRWLQRYERFWSGSLDRLVAHAETNAVRAKRKPA
jgi:DNA-binding transcriptional ArsR family regulator